MSAALGLGASAPPRRDGGGWGVVAAFLAALALHAGALALLVTWRPATVLDSAGEQRITVDLPPALVEAPSLPSVEAGQPVAAPAETVIDAVPVAPLEASPIEPTPAPPVEVAPVEAPRPAPAPPAVTEMVLPPDVAPIESAAAEAPPLLPALAPPEPPVTAAAPPPPETVVARPLPPPPPRPLPRPVERRPPARPETAPRETPGPVQQATSSGAAGTREGTGGTAATADRDVLTAYGSQLARALKDRLRYPEAARAMGATGSATLRFTVNRSGQVLAASIVRSAGDAALDAAALAVAAPGTALPPAPDVAQQEQFTFTVPLRFDLR